MMKKKRPPHVSSIKPHPDSNTRGKVAAQTYTNYAKVYTEYGSVTGAATVEPTKDAPAGNINRSISLNKQENNPPVLPKPKRKDAAAFGCTYFGQGFFKAPAADGRPSPYSQQKSSAYRKTRINSMHKTANYWNVPAKTKHTAAAVNNEYSGHDSGRKKHESNSSRLMYGSTHLPAIEQKTVHFTDVPETDSNDTYIKYVSQAKRSRALPAYANRSKEGEQGQIVPLEKRVPPADEAKSGIRAFNWEGIHFEVSPKRDGSCDSVNGLQPEYVNDMNLMFYNFNGSNPQCPRNGSESPHPEPISEAPLKKVPAMHNKTSSNFAKSWKRGNAVQSPLGNYPKSGTKVPIDRIEEEPEPPKKPKISPRQPGDGKIRLENEAKRALDRPEEQSAGRRKKSPPPLTPITNNSTVFVCGFSRRH